ncbi:MAG: DUF309 domain-containing protein [Pseudonocardia sp.]
MDYRDRDARGRARSARSRDAAGRPLPRDADLPRPPEDSALDPDAVLPPREALDKAQRLLDADLPFTAHEVLESAWKAAEGDERALWQGLAQLAVGLTHVQRGNASGAAALLERGAERIAPFAAQPPHGVAVDELVAHATELAARVRTGGVNSLSHTDRRPRLRHGSGGNAAG